MNPTIHNPKSEKTTRIRGYPYPYPQYKPQILYSRFFVSEKYKLKKTNANGEEDPKQRNPSKAFLEREQTEEEKKFGRCEGDMRICVKKKGTEREYL